GDIVGGYIVSSSAGQATSNTVTIKGNPNLANSTIYGGYNGYYSNDTAFDNFVKGNTLNLYSKGLNAKNIANFENINFYLPADFKHNDTVLTLHDTKDTDISKAKVAVGVIDGKAPKLEVNERVNLLHSLNAKVIHPTDMSNHVSLMQGVSKEYTLELKNDEEKYLYALVTKVPKKPVTPEEPAYKENPGVKSFLEAELSTASLLNQGVDLTSSDGIKAMRTSYDEQYGLGVFSVIGGSDIRYKTGSYVDIKGFNFAAGVSNSVLDNSLVYGLFFEYGKGEYDSFNSFANSSVVRGSGDTKYYGLAFALEKELEDRFYIDASVRAGRSKSDYKSNDFNGLASFDISRNYYGAHIGVGKIVELNSVSNLNLYTKLLYSRLEGKDVDIRGDKFSFNAIDSIRTKLGARYEYLINNGFDIYTGVAWEKEYDGEAKGFNHATNKSIDAPKLKGDSAVLELGSNYQTNSFNIGTNLQGYLGDKEGISGGVKVEYKF
ncbi:autotransporter outer membrane beta-barrel domain-containing protein, partial [Campylobacter geochelonis]